MRLATDMGDTTVETQDPHLFSGGKRKIDPCCHPDVGVIQDILAISSSHPDLRQVAEALVHEFGTLAGVINAPLESLMVFDGIGEIEANTLKKIDLNSVLYTPESGNPRPVFTRLGQPSRLHSSANKTSA